MQKYIDLAKDMGLANAVALKPKQVFFDPRALLKCRWGCEDFFKPSIKCGSRGLSPAECRDMVGRYQNILLLHGHDARLLSQAVLAVEAAAFGDGHHFAFGIRTCNLCKNCAVDQGEECVSPEKVRPCDQAFGIDMFRTVKELELPLHVLKSKDETQNRYGFVLIN